MKVEKQNMSPIDFLFIELNIFFSDNRDNPLKEKLNLEENKYL